MKKFLNTAKGHLMTGISYALPMIIGNRPITRYLSNHSFLQYTVIKNKLEDFLCHNLSSH